MIDAKTISDTLNRAAPIYMMNRAVLKEFLEYNAANTKANIIAGIETAAREVIAVICLLNP